MGHKRLKKCSKYEMVIILVEKQRFSFANFLHLFIKGSSLTHSALYQDLYIQVQVLHSIRIKSVVKSLRFLERHQAARKTLCELCVTIEFHDVSKNLTHHRMH